MQGYFVVDMDTSRMTRVYSATDEHGESVRWNIADNPTAYERVFIQICQFRKPLTDMLWSISHEFVVSTQFQTIVESKGLASELVFVPATIKDKKGRFVSEYRLAVPRKKYDVLDYSRAEFNYFTHALGQDKSVKAWAIDEARLPSEHIFCTSQGDWLASEAAVDEFRRNSLTGFKFVPVEEYRDDSFLAD